METGGKVQCQVRISKESNKEGKSQTSGHRLFCVCPCAQVRAILEGNECSICPER